MNAKANYGLLGNYGVSTEVYHVKEYTLVRMVSMGAVRIWAQRARGNLSAFLSNLLATQKQFNNEVFSKTNKQKKRKQKNKKALCVFLQ